VTAGVDKTIKLWDLRSLKAPLTIMYGHRYPIKKVKCSPHHSNIVISASYDMQVNVFDTHDFNDPIKFQHKNHTEFVTAIDFNLFNVN
jgi:peroxin-7